jgi:AcrR family transcriptional regulator
VRREATRARVFAAAIACLHAQGYAGASTSAVAARARISRGALLKQFPSKAGLYAELVEQLLDEMREETLAYIRRYPPGLPRAMARVDHVWALYKEPRAFAVVEVMLGARSDPELSERLAKVGRSRNRIEKRLLGEEFEAMGIVDRRAAGLAAVQMLAAIRGLALERLLSPQSGRGLDAVFALQRRQTEAIFRALMPPADGQRA